MERTDSREQVCCPSHCRYRQRKHPSRTPIRGCDASNEIGRGKVHSVADKKRFVSGLRRGEHGAHSLDHIADVGEAAAIVNGAEGKRNAALHCVKEAGHVRFHSSSINERQTQYRRVKSFLHCGDTNEPLRLELARAVCVSGHWCSVFVEDRTALACDSFYRAYEEEAFYSRLY